MDFNIDNLSDRIFKSIFGISKLTYNYLVLHFSSLPINYKVEGIHILWTFYFIKVYTSYDVAAVYWGCDVQTYSKWVWKVITLLNFTLDTVSLL